MVDIRAARQQVIQARQIIQQQEQQVQEARQEIQQTQLKPLTRAELQVRGREDIIRRKLAAVKLEGVKKEQLTKLNPLDVQIKEARGEIDIFDRQVISLEQQIKIQKEREAAFKKALDVFRDPDPRAIFGLSGVEEEFFRKISQGKTTAVRLAIKEAQAKIKAIGLKPVPVIEDGKLVAFRGEEIIKNVKETIQKIVIPKTPLPSRRIRKEDPLKFFVATTLPEFARQIFKDFVNNPQDRKAIRDSLGKLQKFGDKNIEKLEKTRVKVEEFLDPRQKEFRIQVEQSFGQLENTQEQLNKDILKFNKEFKGELSETKFEEGTVQATTFVARQRAIDQRFFEVTERVKRLRNASEFEIETFFKSTLKGIVTSPITLAQLGIGVSTRPIKTTKDFAKAIKELPSTLSQTPFSTVGTLLGTAVGTSLIARTIVASPQLFKGGKSPLSSSDIKGALRKGGKSLDDAIERFRKSGLVKDKKGQATIELLLRKKKKKKRKDDPFGEFMEELSRLDDIGATKTKNKLIDDAIKGIIKQIKNAKTFKQKKKLTDGLKVILEVLEKRKLITIKPLVFQVTGRPKSFNSKRSTSELRIIPKKSLQTTKQKELILRLKKQRQRIQLFERKSTRLLKKQRTELLTRQNKAVALLQKSRQTDKQKDREALVFAIASVSAQSSKLESTQKSALIEATSLANALLSTQTSLVSSRLLPQRVLIGRRRVIRKRVKARPKPKIPKIPIIIKKPVDERLIKAVQKLGKKGVDIIVGIQVKKRKIIGKNLPKWKALKKAQRFVDSNIEASYLLKKSGKKAKGKDIKPFNPSFKFRSSKANPLFVVEKRKFRLDMPREVRQLKTAKLNVPRTFFPKLKKKRKKK